MNLTRITVIAAAGAVAAWAVKGVAIGVAGGLGESPFEGPLFLLGLLLCTTACGALAADLASSRGWWSRVGAALASLVAVVAAVTMFNLALDALVTSNHWVWSELNLWVLSLVVLAGGVWHSARAASLE